jgi:hypothetical protein
LGLTECVVIIVAMVMLKRDSESHGMCCITIATIMLFRDFRSHECVITVSMVRVLRDFGSHAMCCYNRCRGNGVKGFWVSWSVLLLPLPR